VTKEQRWDLEKRRTVTGIRGEPVGPRQTYGNTAGTWTIVSVLPWERRWTLRQYRGDGISNYAVTSSEESLDDKHDNDDDDDMVENNLN